MPAAPPDQPHPLAAIRRTGVVAGVANLPATVTVNVGGDPTDQELPYLASYLRPAVGDLVAILAVGGDQLVLGPVSRWANLDGSTGNAVMRYYSRLATYSKAVPNTTVTALTSVITVVENNGIGGTFWSTGVFTNPLAGFYLLTFNCDNLGGTTSRANMRIRVNGNNVGENERPPNIASDACAVSVGYWLALNDTVDFAIWQNSGGSITYTGYVSVARMQGG